MSSGKDVVLMDIDHVISDAFWRDPMIGGDWDEYHQASVRDKPVLEVAKLIDCLSKNYRIFGLTARPGKWRALTMKWLYENKITLHNLLMREDDCFRPSPEMKISAAKKYFGSIKGIVNSVAFVMDDREDVVLAFRAIGVHALQVFIVKGEET